MTPPLPAAGKRPARLARGFGAVFAFAPLAGRADGLDSGDTAWTLTAAALVLLMTLPGVALFFGGRVRARNALSVLVQCMAAAALATVLWTVYGYSLAFGNGGWFAGGFDQAFFAGVTRGALHGTIPESVFAAFQLTFAILAAALVTGGSAERMRFSAMLWFGGLWLTLVYFPSAHWVWGGGWLGELGMLDHGGGTVVHVNAGVAALTAAAVLGKRRGPPDAPMPPHHLVLTIAGACLLWSGWSGANAGRALAANGDAGMALLATQIARPPPRRARVDGRGVVEVQEAERARRRDRSGGRARRGWPPLRGTPDRPGPSSSAPPPGPPASSRRSSSSAGFGSTTPSACSRCTGSAGSSGRC